MTIKHSIAADGPGSATHVYRSGRLYAFPADRRGHPALPTVAAAEKASDPEHKLAIAGQLADVIHIQAETAVRAGSTGRLADLVFRSGQVLDTLDEVVDSLTDDADPAAAAIPLEHHQRPLAGVLAKMNVTLGQIAALVPTADETVGPRTTFRLRQFDIRATTLAAKAGLDWQTLLTTNPGDGGVSVVSTVSNKLDVIA